LLNFEEPQTVKQVVKPQVILFKGNGGGCGGGNKVINKENVLKAVVQAKS
jgi:hypothetical protein